MTAPVRFRELRSRFRVKEGHQSSAVASIRVMRVIARGCLCICVRLGRGVNSGSKRKQRFTCTINRDRDVSVSDGGEHHCDRAVLLALVGPCRDMLRRKSPEDQRLAVGIGDHLVPLLVDGAADACGANRGLQLGDAAVDVATQLFVHELGKSAFHEVQP
jgi:hypothetical protein